MDVLNVLIVSGSWSSLTHMTESNGFTSNYPLYLCFEALASKFFYK